MKSIRKFATGQNGAAILIMAVILLLASLLMVMFSTAQSQLQQKASSNGYARTQAFAAAEAGLNFGLAYLNQNISTIVASAANGSINYGPASASLTNVALLNNSTFSVVITNPTSNNYQLLQITSIGTSMDGSAVIVMHEQVYQYVTYPKYTSSALLSITLTGGASLNNSLSNLNVDAGANVTILNGGFTVTAQGILSLLGFLGSDITQNDPALASTMSESAYFQNVFGVTESSVADQAAVTNTYYNNAASNGDYSLLLNGVVGKTIYISQTNGQPVTIDQGVTIGSPTNPVTIITEGNLNISNGATIYGTVYSSSPSQPLTITSGAKVYGSVFSAGSMAVSGGVVITFEHYPLLVSSASVYTIVNGSWKDF